MALESNSWRWVGAHLRVQTDHERGHAAGARGDWLVQGASARISGALFRQASHAVHGQIPLVHDRAYRVLGP